MAKRIGTGSGTGLSDRKPPDVSGSGICWIRLCDLYALFGVVAGTPAIVGLHGLSDFASAMDLCVSRGFDHCVHVMLDFLERIPSDVGVQRFTADASGDLLIAPQWCRAKSAIRKAMLDEFARRGTRQDSALEAPPSGLDAEGTAYAGTIR
jgi:hypothetical protein